MEFGFSYNFPGIRGLQAGKEYYIAMCPLRVIPKIFLFDEDEVPPEYRSQRIINRNRIPEITNYILDNPNDYVFSSLTASIDGEVEFTPTSEDPSLINVGMLSIALDAKFLINDGQHRRAAIEEALKINPELGSETISVVFFIDKGLKNSQQIFSDLNRHAVNTTSSIGILYDHRDKLAIVTKDIVSSTPFLKRYTDKERVSLSKNSPKIVALNHVFNTNLKLLGISKGDAITKEDEEFLHNFWSTLTDSISEWHQVMNKDLTPKDIRMNYIVGHGVFFEAIGIVGNFLRQFDPNNWQKYIKELNKADWSRQSGSWEGRAIKNGRVQKNAQTIKLTAIQIKKILNLPLSEQEKAIESEFIKGVSK
ncbi:DNA sulfur modification protein DndB [Oceanobacillus luteolus]|uniref:DNA sulfur modification protein DndB n=1 Tax=Oceanobacillus luteolus TaxID=1274358 RepID=UPI00203E91D4|nr:DNA sulfur modification protein DndB [Oceanobacillus luteolus]MCM3741910.1 DNA sulfur modification protein DndB [Oceanobacillus luteolus]